MERLIRLACLAALPLWAAVWTTPAFSQETETIRVKAVDRDKPKQRTLRFLEENGDFFRGRLDALLMTVQTERNGDGQPLDPRFLRYQEMLAEILAAREAAQSSEEWARQRELMDSVGDLAEFEAEMDEMDSLLGDQANRLAWLEEDFVGHQSTAVVVLLTGIPASGAPTGVVLADPSGETVRVSLSEAAVASLARGGSVELMHELVEPREHTLEISLVGEAWTGQSWSVPFEPARDRLTFLELDASRVDPAVAESQVTARHWTR
ncbi:MAG: hypothetical protein DHS20C21_04440 [Gemmatimonadota bacterium]|nr:MAG: hypothetical protein DHS20C21_04440 [Gemmatimonadota bacterium]